ncbi:type II toxin-antitoxin system VapB family antitoxin [Deferribacter autotrophicus]|uniref:Type II toxin-antitoxin system VapB family antitoxin n=1 Tax=Deferribacter autotrophicus TaxID=500465 RepID=A0A5A8F749_9BACT|nr:type II toxin-antitoxin system VapB family antitoxin [Deferribacter autotrophicus]KAA0257666.1 type II toxin-antitoxin system VapB family antitoxin [Deferribacter autotrophicus]
MRTTIDIPDELIKQAMEITKIKTKKKLIITALEELIRKNKIEQIKEFKGKVDLNIDLNKLRDRNAGIS